MHVKAFAIAILFHCFDDLRLDIENLLRIHHADLRHHDLIIADVEFLQIGFDDLDRSLAADACAARTISTNAAG